MQVPLFRLQCGVNSYDWGKIGQESAAARFANTTPASGFSIEEAKPYAELWMGTHPSNPSKDVETQRSLLDLVQDNQALMSSEINERYGGKLPFLFKVLSIRKALSIQAHPNKKLAEVLHQRSPSNYPDDNHKPEMTIALNPFEGLCGFRPLAEITHFLRNIQPFRDAVGAQAAEQFEKAVNGQEDSADPQTIESNKKALRSVFSSLMKSPSSEIAAAAEKLVLAAKDSPSTFASLSSEPDSPSELAELVIRLNGQFPNDIGLFVLFFLNFVKMEAGEAMFLKADDIHAYISGDIIECMASSDNVVRAGFTPKFKDVDTLTDMLTYSYAPIEEQKMQAAEYPYAALNATAYSSASSVVLYDPPIEEFAVAKADLNRPGAKATFEGIVGPSIVICTRGQGKISIDGAKTEEMKEGNVFFVGATATCVVENTGTGSEDEEDPLTVFKAFCELDGTEDQVNGRFGALARRRKWLVIGALTTAMSYSGAAAIHAMLLVSPSRDYIDLNIYAIFAITSTAVILSVLLLVWSTTLGKAGRRLRYIVLIWFTLVLVGSIFTVGMMYAEQVHSEAPACVDPKTIDTSAASLIPSETEDCSYACFHRGGRLFHTEDQIKAWPNTLSSVSDTTSIYFPTAVSYLISFGAITMIQRSRKKKQGQKGLDPAAYDTRPTKGPSKNSSIEQRLREWWLSRSGAVISPRTHEFPPKTRFPRFWAAWENFAFLALFGAVAANCIMNEVRIYGFPTNEEAQEVGQWAPWVAVGLVVLAQVINKYAKMRWEGGEPDDEERGFDRVRRNLEASMTRRGWIAPRQLMTGADDDFALSPTDTWSSKRRYSL
ncbi:Mannose-6-phosphate isomerase [Arachnomyces sp. PD_36]|nr:Mannose-6-phosphate isomerase [Arachnomyces sp. PD_36]